MSTFLVSYYVITSFTISNTENNLPLRTKAIDQIKKVEQELAFLSSKKSD